MAMEDKRNVIDYFKHMETVLIKGALNENRREFVVAMEGFQQDFNVGTVLRNANSFLAKEVLLVGGASRRWDKRGAVGTHHYENITYVQDLAEFKQKLVDEGRPLIIMEDADDAKPLPGHQWADNSCILLGAEAIGVSDEVLRWVRSGEIEGEVLWIPSWGSSRSLNAATASGIAMYDYATKVIGEAPPWVRR